jgi:hypothetical protein
MDMITGLPMVKGKNAILTIVNQGCSRAAIFLPCNTTITGPEVVQLYHDHVFQWFGLSTKVISDCDPRFTSHFRKAFASKLEISQNLSTAFHLQTDGLLECKNQWVEQYLHLVTSAAPKDWTHWLALALAKHNNRRNKTTKLSPNQILLGYDTVLDPGVTPPSNNETAEERIQIMTEHQKQAIEALNQVTEKSGMPLAQYNTGDQVWLEGKHLRLPYQSTKLAPKRYGPSKSSRKSPLWHISWHCPRHGMFMMCFTLPSYCPIAKHPHTAQTSPDHCLTLSMVKWNMRWSKYVITGNSGIKGPCNI